MSSRDHSLRIWSEKETQEFIAEKFVWAGNQLPGSASIGRVENDAEGNPLRISCAVYLGRQPSLAPPGLLGLGVPAPAPRLAPWATFSCPCGALFRIKSTEPEQRGNGETEKKGSPIFRFSVTCSSSLIADR